MKILKFIFSLIVGIVLVASACGLILWNPCGKSVSIRVENGTLQPRNYGDGWFLYAPPGYSRTEDYIAHMAGSLAKRVSNAPDGWEKFKLAGACGGDKYVADMAGMKNLAPNGQSLARVATTQDSSSLVLVFPALLVVVFAVAFVVIFGRRLALVRR